MREPAALALWLAREWTPVLRAPTLPPEALDDVIRRRAARVVRSALAAPFWRERLLQSGAGRSLVGRAARDGARFDAGVNAVRPAPLNGAEQDVLALLAQLPPTGKGELRDAAHGALAGGRVNAHWRRSRSSGSTGEPFETYFDARAWAVLKYLVKLRTRMRCGLRLTDRVAVLDAVPVHRRAASPLERMGRLRVVSVLQPAECIAQELLAFRPRVLYGLPSVLAELAPLVDAAPRPLAVHAVFTGGELLSPAVRERIGAALAARVHDVYGTSETKEIAWECAAGSMHVNADVVVAEVLDENGSRVKEGEVGALVVTSLMNAAMPLLRYRTGDRGSLRNDPCACGCVFPRLGIVSGREVETITLPSGRRVSPYELTCAMEAVAGVRAYRIRQTAIGEFEAAIVPEGGVDTDALRAAAVAALRRVLEGAEVEACLVDELPRGARGKRVVVAALAWAHSS
ncbi:MAG TPA: AMP-binding protein [Gemmatimonadaceae bacterium]|nr:AMP-binding protein [Gemmatimonadaceae bacterium]